MFSLLEIIIVTLIKMTKSERINIKERVDDDTIDLSLSNITEIPVKDIVSILF